MTVRHAATALLPTRRRGVSHNSKEKTLGKWSYERVPAGTFKEK